MNICFLTTNTTHHLYFAKEVTKHFGVAAILVEKSVKKPPFEVFHPFEELRDQFEKRVLLENTPIKFADMAKAYEVDDINSQDCFALLKKQNPDVLIVFGTGVIKPYIFKTANVMALNLHGGNPEEYRGLDSHLWAVYHKDFNGLETVLHELTEELDGGDIIKRTGLTITKNMKLEELRAENTKACIDMTIDTLKLLANDKKIVKTRQQKKGRNYSFMPACLKEQCVINFNCYTELL